MGRLELSGGLSLVVLVPRGRLAALSTLERALDPPTFLELLRWAVRTPSRATALALPRLRLDHAVDVVALVHDMGQTTQPLPVTSLLRLSGLQLMSSPPREVACHDVTPCSAFGPLPRVPLEVYFPTSPKGPSIS